MQQQQRVSPFHRRPARPLAAALALGAAVFGTVSAPRPAAADAMGDTARSLVDKYQNAVIQFTAVVKFSGGPAGEEANQQIDGQGLVMDASGLIVTTNSAIDPLSAFTDAAGPDSPMSKITSKVVSVRVLGKDGTDMPAKVVLRDTDRNLAFLRLIAPPASPLPFVDLKAAGNAQVGDPLFALGRMGKTGNRGPVIGFNRVSARLERPRLLYVIQSAQGFGTPGSIVFNEQGQPLGLLNIRFGNIRSSGNRFGGEGLYVVVPADDVLEDGNQAPQAKDVKDTDAETAPATPPAAKPAPKAPGGGSSKSRSSSK